MVFFVLLSTEKIRCNHYITLTPSFAYVFNENMFLAHALIYYVLSCPQRDDVEVLDEPLYANFLRVTGYDRPYREELLSKMVCTSSVASSFVLTSNLPSCLNSEGREWCTI